MRLSVGAPSSPFVSNAAMYFFDKEISEICNKNGISYTRYADDLTFSTNKKNILIGFDKTVEKALRINFYGDIVINKDKTIISSKAFNRHVTGITLTNDNRLSLGRERKRIISAMIHKYKLGNLSHDDTLKLHGLIGHAMHIEPIFVTRMATKYGSDVIKNITKYN